MSLTKVGTERAVTLQAIASAMAIKYARFLQHVRGAPAAARAALDAAVARDPLNARLHMQRLDLALHAPGTPYAELEGHCRRTRSLVLYTRRL